LRADDCVAQRQPITPAGLDMYMLIDASASLLFSWGDTQEGLAQFLYDAASSGVGVGLQFFGESCDPARYAQPLVPIAALPQNAQPLLAAFPIAPTQETPTRPALQGALDHARRWQRAHPTRVVIVTLVTDGFPEECDSTAENVSEVASKGLAGSPPIRTYVVGIDAVGDILNVVSGISAAAGPAPLTVPPQSAADLARAFAIVRDDAASCRYVLPSGLHQVAPWISQLRQTALDGTTTSVVVVPDAEHCDPDQGGVYVDATLPSQLLSCAASCPLLRAARELELLTECPD
jgi:hypothetical protein